MKTKRNPPQNENARTSDVLTAILSRSVRTGSEPIHGIVIGHITGTDEGGRLMVDFPGNQDGTPLPAVSVAGGAALEAGVSIALAFDGGDAGKPIVLARIVEPVAIVRKAAGSNQDAPSHERARMETLTLDAEKELVIRCGNASITLTSDGKVVISGTYLLSRSKGANRIMGGSVQLN